MYIRHELINFLNNIKVLNWSNNSNNSTVKSLILGTSMFLCITFNFKF